MKSSISRLVMLTIALILFAVIFNVLQDSGVISAYSNLQHVWVEWGLCVLWAVIATLFVRHSSRLVQRGQFKSDRYAKVSVLASRVYSAVGYTFVVIIGLHLLHVKVASILVGGALTGVIVGIGAQSTLSNFFAGLVLFTLRPFTIGQTITVRTYLFSGVEYSGVVQDINWYHTIILTEGQRRIIPNSSIIVSAITVISDEHTTVFVVPLPYSVSVHQFEHSIQQEAGKKARVVVRDFGETIYNCEVRLPIEADIDVLRGILNEYQKDASVSE